MKNFQCPRSSRTGRQRRVPAPVGAGQDDPVAIGPLGIIPTSRERTLRMCDRSEELE
ncbi:hypothetical protein ATKI12_4259 [Kitasatospora sp. Ki12]